MAHQYNRARLLVLCKTYPSPSSGYVETSCVAAMTEDGRLIRLYPVPFRLLEDEAQFKKWQWIDADIAKANSDHRPESYRLRADTLECVGPPLPTRRDWSERRHWLDRLPAYRSMQELEQARLEHGTSLGLLVEQRVESLQITAARNPTWTDEELSKLARAQGDLFSTENDSAPRTLRKLPFDFHYRYRPADAPGAAADSHKIVDWEAGALYWNLAHRYGPGWELAFRDKFERELPAKDLMFLMGTIHRFPDQWLIVSVIYPPLRRNLALFP